MGRSNVDEELYNDPRFRRLCRLLAWPHPDFVVGALARLWIFAGNRVDADNPRGLVPLEDAEDATDHRGLIDACIQSGMAQVEDGLLYFCGIEERSKNLAQRSPSKGGKARAATAVRDERGRMLPSGSQRPTSALVQRESSALEPDASALDQRIQPSAPLRSSPLSSADHGSLKLVPTDPPGPAFDFEALYRRYPRKEGKQKGLAYCEETITTAAEYEALRRAIANYAAQVEGKDPQYTKHFSSFMRCWKDYVGSAAPTPRPQTSFAAPMESEAERMARAFERDAKRFGLVDAEGNPT